jgi:hypothetical protein
MDKDWSLEHLKPTSVQSGHSKHHTTKRERPERNRVFCARCHMVRIKYLVSARKSKVTLVPSGSTEQREVLRR